MLEAGVLVVGAVYVLATIVADTMFSLLNPRIRYRSSE
jgi:peptide/nickel transport system permease protein